MATYSGHDTHYDDARSDLEQKVHEDVSVYRYEPVSVAKRKAKMLPSLSPLQKFASRSLSVQQSVQLATPCSIKFGEGVYVNFGVQEKLIIMFMYGNKCAVFRKSDGTVAILTNAQFQGNAPAMLDGSKYGNLLRDVIFTLMYAIAKIDRCYDGGLKFSRNDVVLVLAECKGTFVGINARKRVGIFPSELVRIITQRREYIYNGMVLRMAPTYVGQANDIYVCPPENNYTNVHEITKSSKGLFSWFKTDGRKASLHELQETSVSERRDEDHLYETIHEVSYSGITLQQKKRMPLPQPGQGKDSASQGDSSLRGEIWFHGNLSREKAEEVLEKDGDFLVRFMSDYPWVYVLSCKTKIGYEHFRLRLDSRSNYHTNGGDFKSIRDLIQVHQSEGKPVSKDPSTIIRTAVPNTIYEESAQNDEEPYAEYDEDIYLPADLEDSSSENESELEAEQRKIAEKGYIKDHSVKSLIKAFSAKDSKVALTEKWEASEGGSHEKSVRHSCSSPSFEKEPEYILEIKEEIGSLKSLIQTSLKIGVCPEKVEQEKVAATKPKNESDNDLDEESLYQNEPEYILEMREEIRRLKSFMQPQSPSQTRENILNKTDTTDEKEETTKKPPNGEPQSPSQIRENILNKTDITDRNEASTNKPPDGETIKRKLQFGELEEGERAGTDIPGQLSNETVEMRRMMEQMNHLKTIVMSYADTAVEIGEETPKNTDISEDMEAAQRRSYLKKELQPHWHMEINDQLCYIVAEYLEPEFFHDVGRKLGVHRNRRTQIERDKTDIVDRTYELLRQWHQRQGQLATIGKLIECLEQFSPEDFTFILEEFCEDLDSSYSSFT